MRADRRNDRRDDPDDRCVSASASVRPRPDPAGCDDRRPSCSSSCGRAASAPRTSPTCRPCPTSSRTRSGQRPRRLRPCACGGDGDDGAPSGRRTPPHRTGCGHRRSRHAHCWSRQRSHRVRKGRRSPHRRSPCGDADDDDASRAVRSRPCRTHSRSPSDAAWTRWQAHRRSRAYGHDACARAAHGRSPGIQRLNPPRRTGPDQRHLPPGCLRNAWGETCSGSPRRAAFTPGDR